MKRRQLEQRVSGELVLHELQRHNFGVLSTVSAEGRPAPAGVDYGVRVTGGASGGRRILDAYEESRRRGETRVGFLKIAPDPVVHTSMVGTSVRDLRKRMESAAATVRIDPGGRPSPVAPRLGRGAA